MLEKILKSKEEILLKGTVILLTAFIAVMLLPCRIFGNSDISGHWAESVFLSWQSKGMIHGYDDGTYRPEQAVSRAEFVRMINQSLHLQKNSEINFNDVAQSDWFYSDISIAAGENYCSGFPDNTFRPNEAVTRAQAASLVTRLKGLTSNPTDMVVFKDNNDIPVWAKESIESIISHKYMSGYPDGTFQSNKILTRAEAISMLDRVLVSYLPADESMEKVQKEENEKPQQVNETTSSSHFSKSHHGSNSGSNNQSNQSNNSTKDRSYITESVSNQVYKTPVTILLGDRDIVLNHVFFESDLTIVHAGTEKAAFGLTRGQIILSGDSKLSKSIIVDTPTEISLKDGKSNIDNIVVNSETVLNGLLNVKKLEAHASILTDKSTMISNIMIYENDNIKTSAILYGNVDVIDINNSVVSELKLSNHSDVNINLNEGTFIEKILLTDEVSSQINMKGNSSIASVIGLTSGKVKIEGNGIIKAISQAESCPIEMGTEIVFEDTQEVLSPEKITITKQPAQMAYMTGENFNTEGMVVQGSYMNDNQVYQLAEKQYTYSPKTFLKAGRQDVIVSAGGKTDVIAVEVNNTNHDNNAPNDDSSSDNSYPEKLKEPTKVLWENIKGTMTATWSYPESTVDELQYQIVLYYNDEKIADKTTIDTKMDFSEYFMKKGSGKYSFTVKTIGDGIHYIDSEVMKSAEYEFYPPITDFDFIPTEELQAGESNTYPGKTAGIFENMDGGVSPYTYYLVNDEENPSNSVDNHYFEIEETQLKIADRELQDKTYHISVAIVDSKQQKYQKNFSLEVAPEKFVLAVPEVLVMPSVNDKGGLDITVLENKEQNLENDIDFYTVELYKGIGPQELDRTIEIRQKPLKFTLTAVEDGIIPNEVYMAQVKANAVYHEKEISSEWSDLAVTAQAAGVVSKEVSGNLSNIPDDITQLLTKWNTSVEQLSLPTTVKINLDTNEECYVPVQWDTESYNPKEDSQDISGTVQLPQGITNNNNVDLSVGIDIIIQRSSCVDLMVKPEYTNIVKKIVNNDKGACIILTKDVTINELFNMIEAVDNSIINKKIKQINEGTEIVVTGDIVSIESANTFKERKYSIMVEEL